MNVPLRFQKRDVEGCGPACARMLLEYFGIFRTFDAINSELLDSSDGTSINMLGQYFLAHGLSVHMIAYFYPDFSPDFMHLKNSQGEKRILKWCEERPKSSFRAELREFLCLGGTLAPRPIVREDIAIGLKNECGVLLLTDPDRADGKPSSGAGAWHYVVPTRMESDYIVVNDPRRDRGVWRYASEDLLPRSLRLCAGALLISKR